MCVLIQLFMLTKLLSTIWKDFGRQLSEKTNISENAAQFVAVNTLRPEVGIFECILTHLHFLCLAKSTSKKKKDTTAKKVNFYFVLISFRGSSWTIPTMLVFLFFFLPVCSSKQEKK